MEDNLRAAIELIHKSPTQAVICVTGGAAHALSWLLSVPGASNTILECRVPYARSAFADLAGKDVVASMESYSSPSAARILAREAYRRAVAFAPPGTAVCGIAAACALATVKSKKGSHSAFVTAHSQHCVAEYELSMAKEHRSRCEEDHLTSRLVIQALFDTCGIGNFESKDKSSRQVYQPHTLVLSRHSTMSLIREQLVAGDKLKGPSAHEHPDPIEGVLRGDLKFAEYSGPTVNKDATSASVIFPGSFNPLHQGHKNLMTVAGKMYPNDNTAFEISITNPDKPALAPEVVRARISQFGHNETILVTSASLFSQKAELFPDAKFVIGVDTAVRLVAPKYYGGEAGLIAALANLKARGCKFLVAGRLEQRKDGVRSETFLTLADVRVPAGFADMFESIPDNVFREDISSSEIRARQKK